MTSNGSPKELWICNNDQADRSALAHRLDNWTKAGWTIDLAWNEVVPGGLRRWRLVGSRGSCQVAIAAARQYSGGRLYLLVKIKSM